MLLRVTLRRVVANSKYGNMWGGGSSNELSGLHEVGLWKNTKKGLWGVI
jgi:hypothetical protein